MRQPYASNATQQPRPRIVVPEMPVETPTDAPSYDKSRLDLAPLRAFCQSASQHSDAMVLELDGLLPIRDFLLDAPIGVREFESEEQRLASKRPRWHSLLQKRQLLQLADVCPGAKTFIGQRKACVGYYLAE